MKTKTLSAVALTFLAGCASVDKTVTAEKDYELPRCSKPIASVMVGQLVCKSAMCQTSGRDAGAGGLMALAALASGNSSVSFPGVGDGMSAMLTTVLKETGCFEIQEREALEELNKELALVGGKVKVQQADFMITGSITSINMLTEKKQFAGGFVPVLGALSTTKKTADLDLDIKVIDVNRAKLLQARTFTGNNQTSSTSWGAGGFAGIGALGGMSTIKGTPMEGVVRDVLVRVASFTSRSLVDVSGAKNVELVSPLAPSPK